MKKNKFYLFILLLLFGLLSNNIFAQQFGAFFNLKTAPASNNYIATDYIRLLPADDGSTGFHFKATIDSSFIASINNYGHDCESAIVINPKLTVNHIQLNVEDSVYWFKFVASDPSIYFSMQILLNDTGYVNQMTLYYAPDNCNNYTQIALSRDGNYLHYGSLAIGNTYMLKLQNNRKKIVSSSLSYYKGMYKSLNALNPNLLNLAQNQSICVGTKLYFNQSLKTLMDSGISSVLTISGEHYIFDSLAGLSDTFAVGIVFDCPPPSPYQFPFYFTVYLTDSINYLYSAVSGYVVLQPYFNYVNNCNTFTFSGGTCITDTIYSSYCTYQYDFGDSTHSAISSNPISTHTYATTGTYNVTLHVYYNYNFGGSTFAIPYICSGFDNVTNTITIFPVAPIIINGNLDDICHQHGIFNVYNPVNNISYKWLIDSASIAVPDTGIAVDLYWHNAPANFITVTGSDSTGCLVYEGKLWIYLSGLYLPYVNPISIIGNLNDNCHKRGLFQVVNPISGITYHWGTTPNNLSSVQSTSGSSNGSIHDQTNIYWDTIISGTVNVYGYDSVGCLLYQGYIPINLTTIQPPTVTPVIINGSLNCNTQYGVFFFNPYISSGITYTWIVPSFANIVTGTYPPNYVLVNWNGGGSDTITLEGRDSNNCLMYKGYFVVNPSPANLTIYGSLDDNCHRTGVFNVISPVYGITYYWTVPANDSVNPSIGDSSTVIWSTIAGNITVVGKDSSGCVKYFGQKWVDPLAAPPPNYSPLSFAQNWTDTCHTKLNVSFNLPTASNIKYTWLLPTGANITSQPTVYTVNVNWNYIGYDTIIVFGYDTITNCLAYKGILPVNPNSCVTNAIQLNSLTASQIIPLFGNIPVINTISKVIFNGITTIDQNLTFTGCPNIMLGSNARINVMPGITLTFNNCKLIQTCTCPWNGIFAENDSSIIVLNNDTIRDAKNAVVSNNGGNFQITSTQFVNDSIGLYVHNYNPSWVYDHYGNRNAPASHSGKIVSSIITKNTALPGYYSNKKLTGIIVDTVYNLMIGDTINSSQMNYFSYLQWGIKIKKSDVNIYNNKFAWIFDIAYNAPSYNGSEPNEAAVFCKTEISTAPINNNAPPEVINNKVIIGSSTNNNYHYKDSIFYCNTGIYAYHNAMLINNNYFNRIINNAIHLKDFDSPSIINSNIIGMASAVYSNDSLHNSSVVVEQSNSYAVVCLDINNNNIKTNGSNILHTGILLRNCNGTPFSNQHCNIQNNEFDFSNINLTSEIYYGLSVYNCKYANISGNSCYGNVANIDSVYHKKLFGISLGNTENAKIAWNNIFRVGDGIYISGSSYGSQYFCNEFDNCWYGFYFNYATLNNQLLSPTMFGDTNTQSNFWHETSLTPSIAKRRLSGKISNTGIKWFYNDYNFYSNDYRNLYCPYILADHPLYSNIISIGGLPPNNRCTLHKEQEFSTDDTIRYETDTSAIPNIITPNATTREDLLGDIVKGKAVYFDLPDENEYNATEYVYKFLDDNPNYLKLGTDEDALYQYFYDSISKTNIGKFYQIGKYINAQDYAGASDLNNSITDQNTIEYNRKTVFNIYLNKVVNNEFLGEEDSLALVDIAYQSPLTGGDAVISARVILGIDPDVENENRMKSTFTKPNPPIHTYSTIRVFPNPANDKLYIVFDNTNEGMATVEMFDLTGKLVYQTTINATIKLQTININDIKKGIYSLRISTNNNIYNQKIVIIK